MTSIVDHYPSRVAETPSIVPRKDPVVYGGVAAAAGGPLSKEQLERFERDGYLSFDKLLSDKEVRAYERELARVWDEAADSDAPEIVREPDSAVVRSVFAIHESNAAFAELIRDPRFVGMAEQILGGSVYVHQSRINYKSGFTGKEFYWHSDFETWHVEDGMPRMRALSISIALSDNVPQNGPLMLMTGSHKHYVTCVGKTPEDHFRESLRKQEIGTPDPDSLTWLAENGGIAAPVGPAGSVVLFDCNTMHGSNSNITPFKRSNVFTVYNSVENALVAPFGGTRPRPDFIASRDFNPIRRLEAA